jgi:predicted transglutaminase-like cysteine proteinase
MRLGFCLVFVAFYFTSVMLFTASLRNANDRIFYKICAARVSQSRLKQQLAGKQLRLENLINPTSVSQQVNQQVNQPIKPIKPIKQIKQIKK